MKKSKVYKIKIWNFLWSSTRTLVFKLRLFLKIVRFAGILKETDLMQVDPVRGRFLRELRELSNRKQRILCDPSLSPASKTIALQNLALITSYAEPVTRLEDLAITFTYLPSSSVYGYTHADLVPNGSDIDVSLDYWLTRMILVELLDQDKLYTILWVNWSILPSRENSIVNLLN